jgi:hypothetical protein
MENNSIVICGFEFDIGSRVVLWEEKSGFNGYDVSTKIYTVKRRRNIEISGKRYGRRSWSIGNNPKQLQKIVTQFFIHHDGLYRSKDTFNVLHNQRGLSAHFLLDDDGILYQTLDLKEKAYHAGVNNVMSVGIEIASRADVNRFPNAYDKKHQEKYDVGSRYKRRDNIQGGFVEGFEYNDKQYATLIRLGIVLTHVFPKMGGIMADFPRTKSGKVIKSVIKNPKKHTGFICHYNSSKSKWDPVAFDHDRFLSGVRQNNPDHPRTFLFLDTFHDRQEALKFLGYYTGAIDGIPGVKTWEAISDFQSDNGLFADGIWGMKTQAAVEMAIKEKE